MPGESQGHGSLVGCSPWGRTESDTTEATELQHVFLGFPCGSAGKNLPAIWETWVWSLGWEDPLEKGKATHYSIFAWRIPWTEEPGRLQSLVSKRVRHNSVTNTFTFIDRVYLLWRGVYTNTWPIFKLDCSICILTHMLFSFEITVFTLLFKCKGGKPRWISIHFNLTSLPVSLIFYLLYFSV